MEKTRWQGMDKTTSLIPFLESGSEGFCLEIPVSGPGDPGDEGFHGDFSPFQIVDNGQCFSMILKASLRTSHAGPFRPLFLLVQRDQYPIFSNGFRTVTNADIDRIWQDTIQSCSADKTVFWGSDPACFKPLFFCRHTSQFFHPLCPECGEMLDLCTDDRLLKQAALPSYHASLKRYLFCPHCHKADSKAIFYQYSRSPEDRVFARDRFDLIRDFNRLRNDSSGDFPCLRCPEHAQCHITGGKALSRISFFSFYPFYMLVFEAAVIKGIDFIPLLSGARIEELPALADTVSDADLDVSLISRGSAGFFFENEPRFFLEVLYLKLSFIEKFVRMLKQKVDNNIRSVVNLSAHSIWLTPRNQGSMLPFFWGFDLTIIDLVSNRHEDGGDIFPAGNRNIEFLAGLWFYTFLVNQIQGHNEVFAGLRQLSRNITMTEFLSDYSRMVQGSSFLAAENIFWNPEKKVVPEHWQPLWLRVLALGVRFIEPQSQDLKTEIDALLGEMDGLKQTVKTRLFSVQETEENRQAVPEPNPTDQEILSEVQSRKKAVRSLLLALRDKWQAEGQIEKTTGNQDAREEDVLETIVLSSSERKSPETVSDSGSDFEDLEKTVVLTPDIKKDSKRTDFERTTTQDDRFFDEDDDLDKTVVIPPKK